MLVYPSPTLPDSFSTAEHCLSPYPPPTCTQKRDLLEYREQGLKGGDASTTRCSCSSAATPGSVVGFRTLPRRGGPSPGYNSLVFLNDDRSLLFGTCGVCGSALDDTGHPLFAERYEGKVRPPSKFHHRTVYEIICQWDSDAPAQRPHRESAA